LATRARRPTSASTTIGSTTDLRTETSRGRVLTRVDEIGGGVWLDPGTASYMVVPELRPGDYAIVCPIPIGATRLDRVTHDHQGATHADEGMIHEFTVE
jgi:hypothetical protein